MPGRYRFPTPRESGSSHRFFKAKTAFTNTQQNALSGFPECVLVWFGGVYEIGVNIGRHLVPECCGTTCSTSVFKGSNYKMYNRSFAVCSCVYRRTSPASARGGFDRKFQKPYVSTSRNVIPYMPRSATRVGFAVSVCGACIPIVIFACEGTSRISMPSTATGTISLILMNSSRGVWLRTLLQCIF